MKEIEKNIINKESTTKKIQKLKNLGRKGLGFKSKKSQEKLKEEIKTKVNEKIKDKIKKSKALKLKNEGIYENNFIQKFKDEKIVSKFSNLKKKRITRLYSKN